MLLCALPVPLQAQKAVKKGPTKQAVKTPPKPEFPEDLESLTEFAQAAWAAKDWAKAAKAYSILIEKMPDHPFAGKRAIEAGAKAAEAVRQIEEAKARAEEVRLRAESEARQQRLAAERRAKERATLPAYRASAKTLLQQQEWIELGGVLQMIKAIDPQDPGLTEIIEICSRRAEEAEARSAWNEAARFWNWLWIQFQKPVFSQRLANAREKGGMAPFSNSIGMRLVYIPEGTFLMGAAKKVVSSECTDCNGAGRIEKARSIPTGGEDRCGSCGGRGEKNCTNTYGMPHSDTRYSDGRQMVCPYCKGNGRVECSACGGRGFHQRTRTESYVLESAKFSR
jgi:hypothetical protein